LGEQLDGSGAGQQEPAHTPPFPLALVDRPAQRFEDPRRALDLVEDDQLVGMVGEVELRLRQSRITNRQAGESRLRH